MKKAVDAKKKLLKRQEKTYEKARAKNQSLDIRGLALANSHMKFGIFKDIFSDLITNDKASNDAPNKFLIEPNGKNTALLDT